MSQNPKTPKPQNPEVFNKYRKMATQFGADSKQSAFDFIRNFTVGGVSAAISKTMIAPIERVKLILQNQDASTQINEATKYKGMGDCVRRIYHEQGVVSFWRGNVANCIRYFPAQALSFSFKSVISKYFTKYDKDKEKLKFFMTNMVVGGTAGACALVLLYPMDFARTRMGVDVGKSKADRQFTGLMDCFKKVYKIDGLRGLYRGFASSVVYAFLQRAAYFGLYDSGKAILFVDKSGKSYKPSFLEMWCLANSTTIIAGIVTYPIDTIRRRLMMQSARQDVLYKNAFDCIVKIYQKEGPKAFFKGQMVNIIR